jgi:AraC-like DNA-binding protein
VETGGTAAMGDLIELSPHLPQPVATVVSAQVARLSPDDRVTTLSVGGAALIEMPAATYGLWRIEQHRACSSEKALYIYQQFEGCRRASAGDSEFVVSADVRAAGDSDLPRAAPSRGDARFYLRLVRIPADRCKALMGCAHALLPRALRIAPGPATLFANYFESFVAQAPHLKGAAADVAVQTLAQLAVLAHGLAGAGDRAGRSRTRTELLQDAMHMVESNIHRSDLSPMVMAGWLRISVRQLHLLFEPTGISYARYVSSRRLERARPLLLQTPKRPVADIVYACGFDSLSTFYRSFRNAFGMSPADFRKSVG